MLNLSLMVNIAVLVPVVGFLIANDLPAQRAYGPDTPARRILICVYGAILLASVALLAASWAGQDILAHAQTLLAVQVIYKLATLPAVGARNPVVIANLGIAALHAATLWVTA